MFLLARFLKLIREYEIFSLTFSVCLIFFEFMLLMLKKNSLGAKKVHKKSLLLLKLNSLLKYLRHIRRILFLQKLQLNLTQ